MKIVAYYEMDDWLKNTQKESQKCKEKKKNVARNFMPARGQDWREQINTAFISLQLIIVYNGHPYLYSTLFSSSATGRVYFFSRIKKMSRNLHSRMLAHLHILYLKWNSEYAEIDIRQLLCSRDGHFMFIESLFIETAKVDDAPSFRLSSHYL